MLYRFLLKWYTEFGIFYSSAPSFFWSDSAPSYLLWDLKRIEKWITIHRHTDFKYRWSPGAPGQFYLPTEKESNSNFFYEDGSIRHSFIFGNENFGVPLHAKIKSCFAKRQYHDCVRWFYLK
jgi:hypothetical protein